MARRQALIALMLCALAHVRAARPHSSPTQARPRRDASVELARHGGADAVDEDYYASEAPFDPFDAWDYDSSEEPELAHRPRPKTPVKSTTHRRTNAQPNAKAKVTTVRAKAPKVTMKNNDSSNRRNVFKTTTVDIESFTKFTVTKRPMVTQGPKRPGSVRPKKPSSPRPKSTTKRPKAGSNPKQPIWMEKRQDAASVRPRPTASGSAPRPHYLGNLQQKKQTKANARAPPNSKLQTPRPTKSTKQPSRTTRAPARSTRAPSKTTRVPNRTTRAPNRTTRAPNRTTRAPAKKTHTPTRTTREHTRVTRGPDRTTRSPKRVTKRPPTSTQPPKANDPCPPKDPGWFTSFFEANSKIDNTEHSKPGFINKVYNLFGWAEGDDQANTPASPWLPTFLKPTLVEKGTTTTTEAPPVTTSQNWFYSFLDSEEDDGAYATNTTVKNPKKPPRKKYNGYQLLRTYPEAAWKVHELLDLQDETLGSGVMWWTTPSLNSSTDILIPPDLLADMKDHLDSLGLDYDVVIWDVQKAIMYENPRLSKKQRVELEQIRGHPLTWRRYHRYADILRYLEYLQHSYPDLVELVPLGRSSEGLPLVAVKVSIPNNDSSTDWSQREGTGAPGKKNNKRWKLRSRMKPAVWLEAGSHAREWIAPAAASWMLHALVEGEKGLGSDNDMLKAADWYFVPVLNPDGYEHSHTHDRLWRKTRSKHALENTYYNSWFPWNWGQTDCVGVDPDRNYDFHWGEKGSSKDACSEQYSGPHPFSEPETTAVSQFIMEHKERIRVYISLHAYSQMWMVPSTHSRISYSDDGEVMEMGKLATAALADAFGTKYKVGTMADLAQPATGASFEWAKGRAGVKYSYNVKMRDSYGPYGFLLPGSQIVPTAKETWMAIKTIVDNL